jgi:hypothetical protein
MRMSETQRHNQGFKAKNATLSGSWRLLGITTGLEHDEVASLQYDIVGVR